MPNYVAVGSEFTVNSTTGGWQNYSDFAKLTGGRFIAVWESNDDGSEGVRGRIFGADGLPIGADFAINTATKDDQRYPSVAGLADGGFIVTWWTRDPLQDGNSDAIKAQRFDSSGAKVGSEFLVNSLTTNIQWQPAVTALDTGGFVITWETYDGAPADFGRAIKAQIYDAAGAKVGGEFMVNTITADSQMHPEISGLSGGRFVAVWTTQVSGQLEVRGQVFDSTGAKVGGEMFINTQTANTQSEIQVSTLANGGFVVTWTTFDAAQDGSGYAIKAQLFDSAGAKVGAEFLVNTAAAASQQMPTVAGLSNGDFVIAWRTGDQTADDASGAIKAQVFSSTGAKIGSEFKVNSIAATLETDPIVIDLGNGAFAIGWTSSTSPSWDDNIKARIYSSGSAPVIRSDGGGDSAAFLLVEHETAVTTVQSFDLDSASVTYSVAGGADSALFAINASTGALSFISAPDFDSPQDSGGNNVYEVVVRASDGQYSDDQTLSITIAPFEDAPAIVSDGGGSQAALTVDEGAAHVTTVSAADRNGQPISYAIVGGADAVRFTLNSVTGALAFAAVPDREAPADFDRDNVYQVIVRASDGALSDVQTLSITVANVNEAPVITRFGSPVSDTMVTSFSEGSASVGTFAAVDPEGGPLSWSLSGIDAALFNFDAATGQLRFNTAPDFEAPASSAGTNSYYVTLGTSDGALGDSVAIAIHIRDLNENPIIVSNGGGATAAVTAAENQIAVTTVVATDPERSASMTYSITGGAEAARFAINASTGVLTFVQAPDFEFRQDSGANNVYDVIVSVSDGSKTDTQAIAVTVANVNEFAPVIAAGETSYFHFENGTAVTSFSASDGDGDALAWSIAGGDDAARFAIDPVTGALRFVSAPDFEAPEDSGADNLYNVTIAVSDGSLTATRALAIDVANRNEVPVITSDGGGASASVSMPENGLAVTTVTASDVDSTQLSYAIAGGVDSALFAIDAQTGLLSFVSAPDREAPGDSGADHVYDVTVSVSDGEKSATQQLSITVLDSDEAPVIASNGGGAAASVSVVENGLAVTTVAATDPESGALSYAISGGTDSALFAVDALTGALSFLAAPNFEAPSDSDGDNVYRVEVSASDGVNSVSQAVSVTVTDQGEAIAFVSGGGGDSAALTVDENQAEVMILLAVDPDGSTPHYSILGGADAASFYLDPATGTLRFHSLPGADVRPDFETPRDLDGDNVYEVIVGTSDGQSFDYQTISVTVANVYEGLGLGPSASFSAQEGILEVGAVSARREAGLTLVYSITGGLDSALFSIDSATGAIAWIDSPDFEGPRDSNGDNVYHLEVTADDGVTTDSQAVNVTLGDVDEPVEMLSHSGAGTVSLIRDEGDLHVDWVDAADPEGEPVTYAIVGGADSDRFIVDSNTGALGFAPESRPDFEAPADLTGDNVYEVTVAASAGGSTATQAFAVTIVNRNDGISITSNGGGNSAGLTFAEGISHVTTVVAHDPDGTTPVYSITGGSDASLFVIDPATGVLRFAEAPDYETRRDVDADNIYEVIVSAGDGELSSSQFLSVLITNLNEAVTITSGGGADSVAVTVDENHPAVADVDAVDADGTAIFYSIAGGADSAFFAIDPLTGALSLAGADHELPGDADGDNVYEVIVSADDGALGDTQAYSVTVADVDEPLSFTSYNGDFQLSLAMGENGFEAASVSAEDPEGGAVVYSIVDGHDGARFTIDPETGELRFVTAPDHESPADLDGDNVYTVLVAATDGRFFDYQNISILVGNVDEAPAIVSAAAASVAENGTAVATVVAEDAEGDPVSYAIAGGADASRFAIDALTGTLSFVQAPDFEAPADSDRDNVYDVIVSAGDGSLTRTQALAVTVANANEAVAITSDGGAAAAQVWAYENDTAVTVVAASDPDGGLVTYSITGGADAARFTIDSSTGALAFAAVPDFESFLTGAEDNVFEVTVSASDGSSTDSQVLTVVLENVVEGIFITSYGGAASVSTTLVEGYFTTYDVDAWHDTEDFAPVYSLSGPDAAFFTIDNQGRFGFDYDAPPNFEGPADADGDNVYEVVVTTSASTFSDSQAFSITIVNRDEGPVFTSGGGEPFVSFTIAENGTVAATLSAVDPEGGAVTYAIYGGFDAGRFTIDPNTGVLSFVDAPDFENPTDAAWNGSGYAERDNVYNVWITATDGTFTASQFIDVTVENVDEPIEILSYGGASSVALTMTEGTGLTVAKVEADDEEDWIVNYAITGGADAALFQINATTGVLAFNYGIYPDFESPQDSGGDNVYDVVVTASSSTSSADQAFALTIADRNEGLSIISNGGGDAVLTMNEGDRDVTVVTAEDQDGDVPTYSIVGGADSALFAIDPATGALSFITAPNFEAPGSAAGTNSYLVEVGASDGEFTGTQRIRVQIGNVNEAPVIASGGGGATAAVTVNENGTAVTSVTAGDVDGNSLTYSITGGADAARFTIESWSGVLRFVQAPDYEAPADAGGNNVYDVVVSVTDGLLTDSQSVAVTVANLAEIVSITSNGGGASASVSVSENGTAVATVAASSPDGGGAVTYAIAGGADSARFTINASTGLLAFVSAPNFEAPADAGANNVYDVIVSASNGVTVDTQALSVTVGNVNEQMAIASNGGGATASVSMAENATAVTTVVGVDPDGGPVTYVILAGGDSSLFTIDSTTGMLSFRNAPNFEAPTDSGANNVYDVTVMASDGHWSDTQAIAVTVGNVAEAPVITSNGGGAGAALSVAENGLAITTVAATDPEGAAATYSIVGGADAARFTINAQTGILQFVTAPDWELPADSNQDNVYAVVVRASDGQLVDDQALYVTVSNVRDGNNVTGTSGSDSISATSLNVALRTSNEEDLVYGRDGHDTIYGMAGDDELHGEGGNDTLIGGDGADKLTGGLGKDQFTYNSLSESTGALRDLILDFSRSQGDKISLSAIDANSLVSTNQAFTFIGTSAFSNVAGQLRYETSGGITTIFGDVNGDGAADLQIQLSGSIALVSSDFLL